MVLPGFYYGLWAVRFQIERGFGDSFALLYLQGAHRGLMAIDTAISAVD